MNENTINTVTKRLEYIDIMKGIGIILVVIGHLFTLPYVNKIIASFHMPLFFFVSGYLHKNADKISTSILKKVKGLLIPYAIYIFHNSIIRTVAYILEKLQSNFLSEVVSKFTFGGIWFIITLFFISVLFYAVQSYIKSYKIITGVTVLIFVFGVIMSLTGKFDTTALNVCTGFSFYCSGHIFKNKVEGLLNNMHRSIYFVLGIVLCIVTCITAVVFPSINMSLNQYGNPVMFYVTALTGTMSCYFIARFIGNFKLLQFYGKNSLIILITHFMVYRIIYMMFPLENASFYFYPVYLIVVLALCGTMVLLVNRFFRFLTGDLKFLRD